MGVVNLIKDILIILIVYIPPLVLFFKLSYKHINKFIIFLISFVYILVSVLFTQNFIPFIFTIIDILYLKKNKDILPELYSYDYYNYGFNLKRFKVLKGLKYSVYSYIGMIIVSAIFGTIFYLMKFNLKEQEIVNIMSKMPAYQFLIMIPVVVIFAPIVEEFVFRWFISEKLLKNRLGNILGMIFSSILFGLIHYNLRAFPVLVWIGLFNCYLIKKEGYWYAVFNHSVFNLINAIVMFVGKI
ncbi:type II CAAX endopeptidase family protein [Clostridium oceanicum]